MLLGDPIGNGLSAACIGEKPAPFEQLQVSARDVVRHAACFGERSDGSRLLGEKLDDTEPPGVRDHSQAIRRSLYRLGSQIYFAHIV